jgi:hypothetical protein
VPLPAYIQSVSAFICQQALLEQDGVTSAIRLVDLFRVPEPHPDKPDEQRPVVQMYAVVIIKTIPGYTGEHDIAFRILNTVGEMNTVGTQRASFSSRFGPEMPGGATLAIQMNIGVNRPGTLYLCIYVDEEEVTRTPFTFTPLPIAPEPAN